jgi:hypothetical protein
MSRIENHSLEEAGPGQMRRRRITLGDGRYLIFYTFTAESDSPASEEAVSLESGQESKTGEGRGV